MALDLLDGDPVITGRAVIGAHLLPRPLQDVSAADLVKERVEPSPGIGLGRPVERSLQISGSIFFWCVAEVCIEVPQQRWERWLVICYQSAADVADVVADCADSVPEHDVRLTGCSRTDLRLEPEAPTHLCCLAKAGALAPRTVIQG